MVEHINIPDTQCHEPKGISSASVGQVYRADGAGSGSWQDVAGNAIVYVTEASQLAGTLDSTKVYLIDGIVDMGGQSIEVPAGGLSLVGWTFDISQLVSSENSYTMFTSPAGGSGNLLCRNLAFSTSGTASQVFNLVSDTGNEAFEFDTVNYNNCTSRGTIEGYRQGLEMGTGYFGGTPTLTLSGTWTGGYFIETSIVRGLSSSMTTPLYAAGGGFTMASRFRSNQNIDLPANASFVDFAPSNFPNPSTLQLDSCIITRNGVSDATDSNLTPNITAADLASAWSNNKGLPNTFEGGTTTVSVEAATTVSATSTFYDVAGTFATSELQHFDSPAAGQLRHLGNDPRDYRITGTADIAGPNGDDVTLKIVKWDNSASTFTDVYTQTRDINNLVGGTDLGFFNFASYVTLDQNDYVKLQVSNNSTPSNLTVRNDSFMTVAER